MAAFPPPELELHVQEPLRGLILSCENLCVAACCSLEAFEVNPEHLSEWANRTATSSVGAALGQFEALLGAISRHRGGVTADEANGCFNFTWQTPYDCLTYFADWRRAIAEAVSQLADPCFFSPAWLTESVVALRDSILADRAFDRLPILADALEEAGCDNRHMLDHLRANDDHSHMCWVLDVLSVGEGKPL